MFDNKWFAGLAFGLVAGLSLAALIYASLSSGVPAWWHHEGVLVTSKDTLANWMTAIIGFVAMILSGWAVWLLSATLAETRRANENAAAGVQAANLAATAAMDERRPWLDYKVNSFGEFQFMFSGHDVQSVLFFPSIDVTNYGRGPALDVSYVAIPIVAKSFDDDVGYDLAVKALSNSRFKGMTVFPDRTEKFEKLGAGHAIAKADDTKANPNSRLNLWITFAIAYSTSYGETFHIADVYTCDFDAAISDPANAGTLFRRIPWGRRLT
jgi:hypothetical protein